MPDTHRNLELIRDLLTAFLRTDADKIRSLVTRDFTYHVAGRSMFVGNLVFLVGRQARNSRECSWLPRRRPQGQTTWRGEALRDLAGEIAQKAGDAQTHQRQPRDADSGDEAEYQSVFGHRLALFVSVQSQ